jgi:hypothetical protein
LTEKGTHFHHNKRGRKLLLINLSLTGFNGLPGFFILISYYLSQCPSVNENSLPADLVSEIIKI